MHDVVIIGAGHNGLVTAFHLAKAGLKPLVLERRPIVGGAAVTEEIHPGFRCSTLAHAAGPLDARIAREMALDRRGLRVIRAAGGLFAPTRDGRALVLPDGAPMREALRPFSAKDADAFDEFHRSVAAIASVVAELFTVPPPSIDAPSASDIWNAVQAGRRFRALSRRDQFRLLRWLPMPVADLVAEWFATDLIRAVQASRGLLGMAAGPWSAGTGAAFLLQHAASAAGDGWTFEGGLGALTAALAAAAREAGAEIRTLAAVDRVIVEQERATGVALANGDTIAARAVVAATDPRTALLTLIGPDHLDPAFVLKLRNYRCVGVTAKVNLALDGLPRFRALATTADDGRRALAGRIHIGPGLDYLEQAFDASKYGEFSLEPYLDVRIPTLTDAALAPPGKHVMSIYAQYAPFHLRRAAWTERAGALGDAVVKTLSQYAPDLERLIVARQVITPLDLERTYGLAGGHIFHGELSLDQLFTMRPLLGWARYRTPILSYYLCGSGTHPGVGLTGRSGLNASREILNDLKARS